MKERMHKKHFIFSALFLISTSTVFCSDNAIIMTSLPTNPSSNNDISSNDENKEENESSDEELNKQLAKEYGNNLNRYYEPPKSGRKTKKNCKKDHSKEDRDNIRNTWQS